MTESDPTAWFVDPTTPALQPQHCRTASAAGAAGASAVAIRSAGASAPAAPAGSSVSSLHFFDPTTAFALGQVVSPDGWSSRSLVLASSDGGRTWITIESLSQLPGATSLPPAGATRLGKVARSLADSLGDRRVHVAQVFSTTRQAAAGGDVVDSDQPVYEIVIEGDFVCETCSRPPGASPPRGSVATLSVDRRTFRVTDFTLTDHVPRLPKGTQRYTIHF